MAEENTLSEDIMLYFAIILAGVIAGKLFVKLGTPSLVAALGLGVSGAVLVVCCSGCQLTEGFSPLELEPIEQEEPAPLLPVGHELLGEEFAVVAAARPGMATEKAGPRFRKEQAFFEVLEEEGLTRRIRWKFESLSRPRRPGKLIQILLELDKRVDERDLVMSLSKVFGPPGQKATLGRGNLAHKWWFEKRTKVLFYSDHYILLVTEDPS